MLWNLLPKMATVNFFNFLICVCLQVALNRAQDIKTIEYHNREDFKIHAIVNNVPDYIKYSYINFDNACEINRMNDETVTKGNRLERDIQFLTDTLTLTRGYNATFIYGHFMKQDRHCETIPIIKFVLVTSSNSEQKYNSTHKCTIEFDWEKIVNKTSDIENPKNVNNKQKPFHAKERSETLRMAKNSENNFTTSVAAGNREHGKKVPNPDPGQTWLAIVLPIVIGIIILIVGYFIYQHYKMKTIDEGADYTYASQITYAELDLGSPELYANPEMNRTYYARIIGVLKPKPK